MLQFRNKYVEMLISEKEHLYHIEILEQKNGMLFDKGVKYCMVQGYRGICDLFQSR